MPTIQTIHPLIAQLNNRGGFVPATERSQELIRNIVMDLKINSPSPRQYSYVNYRIDKPDAFLLAGINADTSAQERSIQRIDKPHDFLVTDKNRDTFSNTSTIWLPQEGIETAIGNKTGNLLFSRTNMLDLTQATEKVMKFLESINPKIFTKTDVVAKGKTISRNCDGDTIETTIQGCNCMHTRETNKDFQIL
jgi:hypothetical protein